MHLRPCFWDDNGNVDVLLIEDDSAIASSLESGLRAAGMTVRHFVAGLDALHEPAPDVYLVDVGLPDIDGFEVVRRIRERSSTPVIMLTARGEEIDRVLGLEIGADDYVTKPFGLRELIARIRAVVRRSSGSEEPDRLIIVGDLQIDLERHRVQLGSSVIELTAKEFDLLAYLASRPGVVHRRNDIMEAVWDEHWYGPTKTLDAHVASLRKKIGNAEWIEAVRGVGFKLVESA